MPRSSGQSGQSQESLFGPSESAEPERGHLEAGPDAPLAARMRPRTLEEFLGQHGVIGPGTTLRRALAAGKIPSMVLWGPPGSGKTTLAHIVAALTHAHFRSVSAVSAGVADLRAVVEDARQRRRAGNQRTILFIDEIHRFNKGQQDAILPHVESGLVQLIGATTENPSFSVNAALLSRSLVFHLEALTDEQIAELLRRALADEERGLGARQVEIVPEAFTHLIRMANGDARMALNALEIAVDAAGEPPLVTLDAVEDAFQHRALLYDAEGEQHYDIISAFIKSLRGSDPDAAIYWLARMLEAGEDPRFVSRRLIIQAAEDVGLADPQALVVAIAAHQAVQFVGMPEGYLPLAEATLYLATAPKSNSALMAYGAAKEDAREMLNQPVPLHLRNAPTGLMKAEGYGRGYQYAHDAPEAIIAQQHLPDALKGKTYYTPKDQGYEKTIQERFTRTRQRREKLGQDGKGEGTQK